MTATDPNQPVVKLENGHMNLRPLIINLMRLLKIAATFGFALVGLFWGDSIGVFPRTFDWGIGLDAEIYAAVEQHHYFTMGCTTTLLALFCSRLMRFPDIAVLVTVFLVSFAHPLLLNIRYFEPLAAHQFWYFWPFLAPYSVGFFAVMGCVRAYELFVSPFFHGKGK